MECAKGTGRFCFVENTTCSDLYEDFSDIYFSFAFQQLSQFQFQLPLAAFMRNYVNETSKLPYCLFLVGDLGNSTDYDQAYVIGDVFFQNFEAQFAFVMPQMKMEVNMPMVLLQLQ